jgi:tRNA threonylcarbamoyladenosine biosynthesis protein TsaB
VTRSAADDLLSREPIRLGIETAGSRCSVAVARGGTVLASESRPLRHGHGDVLMPMVDRVMAEAKLSPGALDIVAAAIGPGGFTGIRVGLAAAQGIALATRARLIGVTGFAAVAHAMRPDPPSRLKGALLVALDSRREDLYVQLFAENFATPLAPAEAVLPDRLIDYLGGASAGTPLLIAGDAAEPAAAALEGGIEFDIVPGSAPDAVGVIAAAMATMRSGQADDPVRPLYLRPPDVTVPKPRGMPAAGPP